MNNNCLVTTLKGVVNNPNLPVFDPIREVVGLKIGSVGQYIDLRDYLGSILLGNLNFEIEFTLNNNVTTAGDRVAVFSARGNAHICRIDQSNTLLKVTDNNSQDIPNLLSVGVKNTIIYANQKADVNGVEYNYSGSTSISRLVFAGLFSECTSAEISGGTNPGYITIHSFKAFDKSVSTTNPVIDLIACADGNDKGLFFDKVSGNKLYANSGDLVVVE